MEKVELTLPVHVRRSKIQFTVNTPKVSISNDLVRLVDDVLGKESAYRIKDSLNKSFEKHQGVNLNSLIRENSDMVADILGERDFNLDVRPEGIYILVK